MSPLSPHQHTAVNRPLLALLLSLAPLAVSASDGMAAAVAAARQAWPTAEISAASTAAAPCEGSAQADAPSPARNGVTQVRVRCTGTAGWTRYLALRISQAATIAVLRAPLARGQALTADLIDWQTRDALRAPADAVTQSSVISALTARRDLAAGSVLALTQFAAPQAIQRGQAVMLFTQAAGLEIRAPGEALADAALGARVRVRNSTSRRVVEGIARADGTVEVAL